MSEFSDKLLNASEIFKALAHPARLCIVNKLRGKSLNVSEMQECLGTSQSSVSQHLSILKNQKIIEGKRNGSEIVYSLKNNKVKEIVEMYFEKE